MRGRFYGSIGNRIFLARKTWQPRQPLFLACREIKLRKNLSRALEFLARNHDLDLAGKVAFVVPMTRVYGRHESSTSKRLIGTVQHRMEAALLETALGKLTGNIIKSAKDTNHAFIDFAGGVLMAEE